MASYAQTGTYPYGGRHREARRRDDRGSRWGAVALGLAIGLGATIGRKVAVQAMAATKGDWYDVLKAEHQAALTVFDKILETTPDQTTQRMLLLSKLKYALSKHAIQEEDVVYPALRDANEKAAADKLNHDHGYIKQYLYDLLNTPKDDPRWIEMVREFRALVAEHAREEEEQIYPPLRQRLTKEQNARITTLMHKEGYNLA